MTTIFQIKRTVLVLLLALGASALPSRVQSQSTNTFPPWPTLSSLTNKYAGLPMAEVERLARSGEVTAEHYLGYCYEAGIRVEIDVKTSIAWYEKALDQGYLPSGYHLGYIYERVYPFQDFAKAYYYFRITADKGFANSKEELLGLARANVFDYLKDSPDFPGLGSIMRESLRLERLAADQGVLESQIRLAEFYLKGQWVEMDETRAVELLQSAVDHGSPEAMTKLAGLYAGGIGEPRDDHERPFALLCRAVVSTNSPDREKDWDYWSVIDRCESGFGTDRDLVAAAQWYCRAALDRTMTFTLADKFDLSRPPIALPGVNKTATPEIRTVVSACLKAAARRDAGAAQQLGTMYLTGRDAPRNAAKAWPWFKLAAQYGAPEAAAKISQAEAGMTTVELEQDQQQFPAFLDELKKVAAAASRNAAQPENP
jgi:TPR repeat protein